MDKNRRPEGNYLEAGDRASARKLKSERRTSFGDSSPFNRLVALGYAADDTPHVQSEKRIAVHLFIALVPLILLNIIGWRTNTKVVVIFIVVTLIAAIAACGVYVSHKTHRGLSLFIIALGAFYSLMFFFSESCFAIRDSGGRVFVVILPTFLFHNALGGPTREHIAVSIGHFLTFVAEAAYESLAGSCDTVYPLSTTNAYALVFIQVVLPLCLVVAGAMLLVAANTAADKRLAHGEAFAKDVLRALMKGEMEGVQHLSSDFDRATEVPTFGEDALMLAVEQLVQAQALLPEHLRGKSPMQMAALSRRISVSNLNAGMAPRPDRDAPRMSPVQAFLPSEHNEEEMKDMDAAGINSHATTDTATGLSPAAGSVLVAGAVQTTSQGGNSDGENDAELDGSAVAATPLPSVSSPTALRMTRRKSRVALLEGGEDHNSDSRRSSLTRKQSVSSRLATANGLTGSSVTTGTSQQISPTRFQMSQRPTFVVAFSLPRLGVYAARGVANVELMKLVLSEFVDSVRTAVATFHGEQLWSSFGTICAKFEDFDQACGAAVRLLALMKAEATHHKDALLNETKAHMPFCVVLHTNLVAGMCGSDPSAMLSVGSSPAEQVIHTILHTVAMQTCSPPAIVGAASFRHLATQHFEVYDGPTPSLFLVAGARKYGPDGLPVCPPASAEFVFDKAFELPAFDDEHVQAMAARMLEEQRRGGGGSSKGGARAAEESADGGPPGAANSTSNAAVAAGASNRKRLPAEIMDVWNKFDQDHNGYLDVDEVRDVLAEIGIVMSEVDLKIFFDTVDADHSGTVTLDEFQKSFFSATLGGSNVMSGIRRAATAMASNTGADNLPLVLAAWKKYDSDGSGSLESKELFNVLADLGMKHTEEEVEWLVQHLDKNGNGTIDFDEFAALFSEDNVANAALNVVKARIQTVTRVMSNKSSGKTYSTADQLLRDSRMKLKTFMDRYYTLPLFFYVIYNYGINAWRVALGTNLPTSSGHMYADTVLDAVYLVWVLLKLTVLPTEVKGQLIYKPGEIFRHYIRTVECAVDLTAIIPLDFIFYGLGASQNGDVFGYYRANKILTVYHLNDLFLGVVATIDLDPALARVANALVWFLGIAHFVSCMVSVVARQIGDPIMDTLVGTKSLVSESNLTYLKSLYWSILTLSGQLSGSPLPPADEQLALLIGCVSVGLPLFTVVLATIGNASNIENSESKFRSKMDELRGYFEYTNLPESVEKECVNFYRHMFNTTGTLDINENPLDDLPVELNVQVVIEIGLEMLKKVAIFKEATANLEFVHELTTKLVPRVIEPGCIVMRKGERGTNMYFITYGDFHIITDTGMIVFTLRKGNFFGEIALLQNVKRTATIQCDKRRYGNVLMLDKRQFDEVSTTFPQCLSQVYKAAEDRIRQILEKEAEDARIAKEKRRAEALEKRRAEMALRGEVLAEGTVDEMEDSDSEEDAETSSAHKPDLRKLAAGVLLQSGTAGGSAAPSSALVAAASFVRPTTGGRQRLPPTASAQATAAAAAAQQLAAAAQVPGAVLGSMVTSNSGSSSSVKDGHNSIGDLLPSAANSQRGTAVNYTNTDVNAGSINGNGNGRMAGGGSPPPPRMIPASGSMASLDSRSDNKQSDSGSNSGIFPSAGDGYSPRESRRQSQSPHTAALVGSYAAPPLPPVPRPLPPPSLPGQPERSEPGQLTAPLPLGVGERPCTPMGALGGRVRTAHVEERVE